MKSGEELSVFDDLFGRIDELASERPGDGREHDEKWLPPTEGTRLTPIREVGEIAVRFMIFSSSTRSLETGKLLYGPTITVFRGDRSQADDFKRSQLENRPKSQGATERHEQLLGRLEEASDLFDEYERS